MQTYLEFKCDIFIPLETEIKSGNITYKIIEVDTNYERDLYRYKLQSIKANLLYVESGKLSLKDDESGEGLITMIKFNDLNQKENVMNKDIIRLYPNTEDAILIEKWFLSQFNQTEFTVLLAGKEKELLKRAQEFEKLEQDRLKKENK